MKSIELSSWSEFPATIEGIVRDFGTHKIAVHKQINRILYRGQSDSNWKLETTLERFSSITWTVNSYSHLALACAPQIESYTDKTWNLPKSGELELELERESNMFIVDIPFYAFWVYLRHHGFPSPLLDWTMSPYIAAFFAFNEQHNAEKAAIFVFIETPEGTKEGWGGEPLITMLGPYVKTHRRHFLQQSCYTLCTVCKNTQHRFESHEMVFRKDNQDQDIVIKITIPRSERIKILSYLNNVNINHFSLFQNEEALMKTLAFREIEMHDL